MEKLDDELDFIRMVAHEFAQDYYYDLLYSPDEVYKYYKDGSVIVRPNATPTTYTIKQLKKKFSQQKYPEVIIELHKLDAYTHDLGVVVYLIGSFIRKNKSIQSFNQRFLLEQQKEYRWRYIVVNDELQYGKNKVLLRDMDDDEGAIQANLGDPVVDGSVTVAEPESQNLAGDEKELDSSLTSYESTKSQKGDWIEITQKKSKTTKKTYTLRRKIIVKGGRGNHQSQNTSKKEFTLDLHTCRSKKEAERETKAFLQSFSSPKSDVTVTVITGRGIHSKDKIPVLLPMVQELLEDLKLNYEPDKSGGAMLITIKQGWSFSSSGCKNQNTASISDVVDAAFKSKDASSSNAQVSSRAGEYMIEANDNDGYVAAIKGFVCKISSMDKDEITLPMNSNIFQQEKVDSFNVLKNGLIDFCQMKNVDATLISAYMRFLFEKYKKFCKSITFVNPAATTTDLVLRISERLDKVEKKIKNQLLFIPYNIQSSSHWVLMVIDCSSMTVFWVDSLHTEPEFRIKFSVNKAFDPLFISKVLIWEIIKGPKQPESVQSGYFVMKFMRDLVFTDEPSQSQSQSVEMKMEKFKGIETYTEEEINLVRAEFSNYIIVLGNMS